jgi:hypothetical protein
MIHIHLRYGGDQRVPMGVFPALLLASDRGDPDRHATIRALNFTADETVVRGVPQGRYRAQIAVPGFRSVPEQHDIFVSAQQTTAITVTLEPQGTLMGRVVASARDAVTHPAGSLMSIEPGIEISALRLEGNGQVGYVVPNANGNSNLLSAYVTGRDGAAGSAFSFVELQAGDYRLTVTLADGRELETVHHVTLGESPANVTVQIPAIRDSSAP